MRFDELPAELIGAVLNFLDLDDVAILMATSRRMRSICCGSVLWRDVFLGADPEHACRHAALLRKQAKNTKKTDTVRPRPAKLRWDPVFEGEPVSWYDEYVQRLAPIAVNWFELPLRATSRGRRVGYRIDPLDVLEVCGAALYWPSGKNYNGITPLLAVSPLEDGSVCMWDVGGTFKRRGAIVQRSAPGLLFDNETKPQLTTDCVSVDSAQHVGYFAVRAAVVAVDLRTLQVVRKQYFNSPVTAISAAHPSVPLTVGLEGSVCLYDLQSPFSSANLTSNYAQSSPLSVLHMPEPGPSDDTPSHDIFVAGRVPTVFQYDRRHMNAPKDTIFSGATLCGLASMAYPHPKTTGYSINSDLYLDTADLQGEAPRYRTLIACGEYKSKGSLELYPIGDGSGNSRKPEPMVNRQTSSSAKILSVATHGKKIITSDGIGFVRWFERDGFREARRFEVSGGQYRFDEMNEPAGSGEEEPEGPAAREAEPESEMTEIVRKLLPTDTNDVLIWTGENLGLLTYSSRPGFNMDDFVQGLKTEEERATEKKGFEYRAKMRQLFESARYFGGDDDSD